MAKKFILRKIPQYRKGILSIFSSCGCYRNQDCSACAVKNN